MKKTIILLLISLSVFILHTCIGYLPCGAQWPPELLERYFHCFDEGNSWVYINQDNSKTDSLYLKCIYENIPIDGDCHHDGYVRRSEILPSCLSSDTISCQYNTYTFTFCSQNWIYDFQCHKETNTLYMQIISEKNGKKGIYLLEGSIVLPNGQSYSDVINCNDRFWIAPNVGIVQFRSYDGEDMFYLKKYYKK